MKKHAGHKLVNPALAEQRAGVLKALGNPVRLRIMACLCGEREKTVGALAERLELPQSTVSRQLSWLRLEGLVQARVDGGYRHYSIAMPQVATLLQCLADCGRKH